MAYHLSSPGWFSAVNGHKVVHHALPPSLMSHATTWAEGSPRQLGFHYQGGCGADLFGTEEARGYPIASLSVDSTGTIHQYGDVERAAWHAYDVSRYAIGVEHAALPGTCELNDRQLEASAALFAALIEYVQDHHGVHIPVRHTGPVTPGNYKTVMGVWGHTDIEHGSFLNPTTHVDTLYHWTWERYLGRVKDHLQAVVTAPAYPGHVLRRGANEPAVITAKRRLHLLGARGFDLGPHFGRHLELAVIVFQRAHGLGADGIIGPATWAAMWKAQP